MVRDKVLLVRFKRRVKESKSLTTLPNKPVAQYLLCKAIER
jgi:hypothetical protein